MSGGIWFGERESEWPCASEGDSSALIPPTRLETEFGVSGGESADGEWGDKKAWLDGWVGVFFEGLEKDGEDGEVGVWGDWSSVG